MAKNIMILGTGSDVGKSIICAGLCRILRQDGLRVAPFKAQNMALNSFITPEGGEMSRAQVVQAEAAGIEPDVDMNPILLKPASQVGSQVIVRGKMRGNLVAGDYYQCKAELMREVLASYRRLASAYEVIVMEGAGSAAEVNLRETDIANMEMALQVGAPVLLVADIDRGGVFATLLGHLELFSPEERRLVKGLLINKFRGDPQLLGAGIEWLQERTGKLVLGLIPYFHHIKIPEEDSVALEMRRFQQRPGRKQGRVAVGVVLLPHISNYTDFDALEQEPEVALSYLEDPGAIFQQDLIILPGSKNTIYDLHYLHRQGMAAAIIAFRRQGGMVIGICGGYQMLGHRVVDPGGLESATAEAAGLGLLDMETVMAADKVTTQVVARWKGHPFEVPGGLVRGYEIHLGRSRPLGRDRSLLQITVRNGEPAQAEDGLVAPDGRVWGCYLHGLFDNDSLRHQLIETLLAAGGRRPLRRRLDSFLAWREEQYDQLAAHLRAHLDLERIYRIIGL